MSAGKKRITRADLTLDYIKTILSYNPESGEFTWTGNGWDGRPAGTVNDDGYIKIAIHKIDFKAHRLAWAFVHGYIPDRSILVDHLNRVRTDNRISNFRLCNDKQNAENSSKPKNNTTGFKGVAKCKNTTRYRAYICHNRKQIHLGMFDTPEMASAAYCAAATTLGWEVFTPD